MHRLGVAVRRVEHEHVGARRDELLGALEGVGPDADGRSDTQTPVRVLGRMGELDPLLDVLDGDQPFEHAGGVDDRKLLDAVAVQE